MELFDDELRRQLPAIRKIHNPVADDQCMIFAKLFTPTSGVTFYVAEGEPRGSDFLLWGLMIAPEFKIPLRFQMTVGRLQTKDWLGKEPCQRDQDFQPTRWGAVERDIPNLRRPLAGSPPLSCSKVR